MYLTPSPITKAASLNNLTFTDYFDRISMLALSMFKWENLPTGIKPEFLERLLFFEGQAVFYKHDTFGHIILHATQTGNLNYQDEPVQITATSPSGISDILENNVECILIKNNYYSKPTSLTVQLFAQRLANIERTMDINLNAQKTPILIWVDEKTRLTMKNIYNQYDGNQPMIYGDKSLNPEAVKVLKTDAPYLGSDLSDLKHTIWNECMTFLGVNNSNQDKKERLVSDEVSANDEQVQMGAMAMLKARQESCEAINRLFGLNLSVHLSTESEMPEEPEDPEEKEGEPNE